MSEIQDVGIDALTELALNMRWSWNRSTDELWAQLDPELWALTHNPWAVLQTVSPRRVQDLLGHDPQELATNPVADLTVDRIGDPLGYELSTFLAAASRAIDSTTARTR